MLSNWLMIQHQRFYEQGIRKLPKRWENVQSMEETMWKNVFFYYFIIIKYVPIKNPDYI